MTVKELVEILETFPAETPVEIAKDYDFRYTSEVDSAGILIGTAKSKVVITG